MPSTNPLEYPNGGLQCDPEKLKEVFVEVIWMPRKAQARYADLICVANATDAAFCQAQKASLEANVSLPNTTAIGNLAYLSIYGAEDTRHVFRAVLERGLLDLQSMPQYQLQKHESACLSH